MDESNVMALIWQYAETIFIIIGAASALFAALSKLTGLTATKKDDVFVGKAQRVLSAILAVLDRLGLNPDKKNARPPKQ